jgi:hypothetical protein
MGQALPRAGDKWWPGHVHCSRLLKSTAGHRPRPVSWSLGNCLVKSPQDHLGTILRASATGSLCVCVLGLTLLWVVLWQVVMAALEDAEVSEWSYPWAWDPESVRRKLSEQQRDRVGTRGERYLGSTRDSERQGQAQQPVTGVLRGLDTGWGDGGGGETPSKVS